MDRLRRIHTALALLIVLSTLDAILALREPDIATVSPWFLGLTCTLSLILLAASRHTVERMRAAQSATDRKQVRTAATEITARLAQIADDVRVLDVSARASAEREALTSIGNNALLIETQLRQVIGASHLDEGAVTLARAPCNVAVLVNEAIKAHRAPASEQGIRLRFDAPLGLTLHADRARIAFVLSTLLRTHVASASRGTLITLDTAEVGDAVQLVLAADVVTGTETSTFRRPFPAPSEDIGLAVAARIIDAHGGDLQFEMTSSGMRVVISLPKTSHYKDEMVAQGS